MLKLIFLVNLDSFLLFLSFPEILANFRKFENFHEKYASLARIFYNKKIITFKFPAIKYCLKPPKPYL